MTKSELVEMRDELYGTYQDIKSEIRRNHPHLYERWKIGGFIIDENVMSMYPCLNDIMDKILEDDKEDEDVS